MTIFASAWSVLLGAIMLLPTMAVAQVTPQTIAAIPPAWSMGRGARLPFVEYEAENASTNGTLLGPDRRFTTIAAEASGRRAVRLDCAGQYVEFTLARPANAVTVRAAVPDSAHPGGLTAKLLLRINGRLAGQLKVSSRYAWFYGRYPFSKHPADSKPHHYFDEARLMFGQTLHAGTRVRLEVPNDSTASWYVIDLADFELVPPQLQRPKNALSVVDFGADPRGLRASLVAFERAIASARAAERTLWIPAGNYRVDGPLVVDDVTIRGAGPWYSIVQGSRLGFYGREAPGGSHNVHLEDFSIIGTITDRRDTDRVSGIGGAMSESLIRNLFIEHETVGLWFDGPMHDIRIEHLRITNTTADGLNFHRGVNRATVTDSFIRNTGDDGLAAWSQAAPDEDITFENNTIIAPILANGIAIYGGRNIRIERNLIADTLTQGGGIHLGNRFGAVPISGTIKIIDNEVVRGGSFDPNWHFGVGALWFYALDAPIAGSVQVIGNRLIDSSEEAVMFIGKSITDVALDRLTIDGAGGAAITLRSAGEASLSNSSATRLGTTPIARCRSEFVLTLKPGNIGFELRNRATTRSLAEEKQACEAHHEYSQNDIPAAQQPIETHEGLEAASARSFGRAFTAPTTCSSVSSKPLIMPVLTAYSGAK